MDVKTSRAADPSANISKADRQIGGAQPRDGMVWLPDGTFRMGSDRFYPEEAPVHRVTVDGFWIAAPGAKCLADPSAAQITAMVAAR